MHTDGGTDLKQRNIIHLKAGLCKCLHGLLLKRNCLFSIISETDIQAKPLYIPAIFLNIINQQIDTFGGSGFSAASDTGRENFALL